MGARCSRPVSRHNAPPTTHSRSHREISKREYPKFLRNIGKLAARHFASSPLDVQ